MHIRDEMKLQYSDTFPGGEVFVCCLEVDKPFTIFLQVQVSSENMSRYMTLQNKANKIVNSPRVRQFAVQNGSKTKLVYPF